MSEAVGRVVEQLEVDSAMRRGRAGSLAGLRPGSAAQTLDMYFIDVEGGQSTLIVTPAGESLLIDTGYGGSDGRDSTRILAAARAAGIKQIDYLLMTHFHPDHDGGVVELSRQMPIGTFFDHGDLVRSPEALAESRWPATLAAYDGYVAARAKGKHVEPKPGERLPLKGVDAVWVSSAAATIGKPMPAPARRTRRAGRARLPRRKSWRTRARPAFTCASGGSGSSTSGI